MLVDQQVADEEVMWVPLRRDWLIDLPNSFVEDLISTLHIKMKNEDFRYGGHEHSCVKSELPRPTFSFPRKLGKKLYFMPKNCV